MELAKGENNYAGRDQRGAGLGRVRAGHLRRRSTPFAHILCEREIGPSVDLNLVIVVQNDQPTKPQMTRKRARLRTQPLLQTSVAAYGVRVVVDQLETFFVERSSKMSLPSNAQVRAHAARQGSGTCNTSRAPAP